MQMKTLVKKNEDEVLAAVSELNDDDKAALLKLELATDTPREAVVTALGGEMPEPPAPEPPAEEEQDDDAPSAEELAAAQAIVDKAKPKAGPQMVLDKSKPFSMINYRGLTQHLQNKRIFDRAGGKFIITLDDAAKENE